MTSNETGPFSIFWIKNREVLKFINILPCFHNALLSESYIFSSLFSGFLLDRHTEQGSTQHCLLITEYGAFQILRTDGNLLQDGI